MEKMKIDPYLSSCTKFNTKWIKGPNRRSDALNLIEETLVNSFELIGPGKNFLNKRPIVQALGVTDNKTDLMKLKSSCTVKDTIISAKQQAEESYL